MGSWFDLLEKLVCVQMLIQGCSFVGEITAYTINKDCFSAGSQLLTHKSEPVKKSDEKAFPMIHSNANSDHSTDPPPCIVLRLLLLANNSM
jgi:hypothetical protein